MRRLFIYLLLAMLAGSAAVAVIKTEPGYVLVSYAQYTLETSLWIAMVLLVLLVFVLYYLVAFINRLLASPGSVSSWLGSHKSQHSTRLTTRGMISYSEGNWSRARQQLVSGAKSSDIPMLNYLLAARASYQLDDLNQASEYLNAARGLEKGAGVAVELTQAELHLEAGRFEQAVAALETIRQQTGRQPRALLLLKRAYEALESWDQLAELLPELRKHKVVNEVAALDLERSTALQRLAGCLEDKSPSAVASLQTLWQSLPSGLRKDQDFVVAYVGLLMELGDSLAADKVATRTLKNTWSPALVRLYGLMDCEDNGKRLALAEKWLKHHQADPQLLLCLGRLCAREKRWAQAREYYERSHARESSLEACAELSRLLSHLGEDVASTHYLREALSLSQPDLPILPMPEKEALALAVSNSESSQSGNAQ